MLEVEFLDEKLPVRATLTAFTPLVPLDVDASSYPAAVLRYRATTPGRRRGGDRRRHADEPDRATGSDGLQFPAFDGRQRRVAGRGGVRGIAFVSDLPAEHLRDGTACLMTTDPAVTAKPQWVTDFWQDGVQRFWDDLDDDGRLASRRSSRVLDGRCPRAPDADAGRLAGGSSTRSSRARPHDFEFVLAWNLPNRPRAWQGNIGDRRARTRSIRNQYATRWPDAWAVGSGPARRSGRAWRRSTRAFHDALFETTLPPEVVDAVSATLAAARSTTCLWLRAAGVRRVGGQLRPRGQLRGHLHPRLDLRPDGRLALFPELERSRPPHRVPARDPRRRADELPHQRLVRQPAVGLPPGGRRPAGESILRLYREWAFSGDDEFLRERAGPRRSARSTTPEPHWDSDGDGLLDGQQHNTYDIEFYGANPLANVDVPRRAARGRAHGGPPRATPRPPALADGDRARARRRGDGRAALERRVLRAADSTTSTRTGTSTATGCLSDQLLGQIHAHVVGLGHLLPADHVRRRARGDRPAQLPRDLSRGRERRSGPTR